MQPRQHPMLQKLGRHGDALTAHEEAARRGPPDAETELNRGNVLQKLGRPEEALAAYDLSSRYRDGYPQVLYNKGIALQGLGRPQEALAAYDAALGLDPSYYVVQSRQHSARARQLADALAACAYTLKIRPGFLPAPKVSESAFAGKATNSSTFNAPFRSLVSRRSRQSTAFG